RVELDPAAGLHDGAARNHTYSCAQVLETEVVEHDGVNTAGQHRFDLVDAVDLHLQVRRVWQGGTRGMDRLGDVTQQCQVVVLGHDRVRQREAVVETTAAAHGMALQGPEPRCRLACVDDPGRGRAHCLHE